MCIRDRDEEACKIGRRVTEVKINTMLSRRKRHIQHLQHYEFDDSSFEAVSSSQYLHSIVSGHLDEMEEIRRRTAARNRAYFGYGAFGQIWN